MKKFFLFLIGFVFLFVLFIIFLFTPVGNNLLKPIVESKINSSSPIKIHFQKFRISFSSFDINATFFEKSYLYLKGNYSLFSKKINVNYFLKVSNLNNLKNVINYPLRGKFQTFGKIAGILDDLKIEGKSYFAKSNTRYVVLIKNYKPFKVLANIKNLELSKLLYILNQPGFIKGKLNSDIVLNNLDPSNLDGNIEIFVKNAVINKKLLHKEYNITIPNTTLNLDSKTVLKGKKVDFFANLISNLANTHIKGFYKDKFLDTDYKINIKNLSFLTPIINQKIRGKFKTDGKIKGNINNLLLKGVAYLANGQLFYKSNINKKHLTYNLKNIKIQKLLYMLYQPIYSYGIINSKGDISFNKTINGDISLVAKGKTSKKVLYKEFNLTNALINYKLLSNVKIKNSVFYLDNKLNTDIAKFTMPNGKYNLNTGVFESPYKLNIPDLDKLYFVTNKHLKGKITLTGNIKKDKNLLVTGISHVLGGKVDFKLLNNDFNLSADDLSVVKLMDMLMYPKIFDSKGNIILKYNLLNEKGKLKVILVDGHFLPNKLSFLINSLAHFDLTKEIYKKTEINSTINDKKIVSDLDMQSRLTHITSKDALVDLEKEYINALLDIEILHKPIFVKIKGNLYSPKISVDLKKYFNKKLKNKIKKEIEKKIPAKLLKMF